MTKKVQTPETDIMVESKTKIESFFDKFGSKLMWGLVAVTVIAVGIFFFINRNEKKNAAEEAAARQARILREKAHRAKIERGKTFVVEYLRYRRRGR